MNIKDLSQDDLALLLSMQFFMCDVNLYNYKDLYEQLGNTDIDSFVSSDFDVWQPFENYPLDSLLSEIDTHQSWLLGTLIAYENTNSQ